MTNKKRLTYKEACDAGLIPWHKPDQKYKNSWHTTKRKIDKGFPHVLVDGHYFFDPAEIELYFKRRTVKAS